MGSFGDFIVDINKVFFGSIAGVLGAAGSAELGADIYGSVQQIYHDLGLGALRG